MFDFHGFSSLMDSDFDPERFFKDKTEEDRKSQIGDEPMELEPEKGEFLGRVDNLNRFDRAFPGEGFFARIEHFIQEAALDLESGDFLQTSPVDDDGLEVCLAPSSDGQVKDARRIRVYPPVHFLEFLNPERRRLDGNLL